MSETNIMSFEDYVAERPEAQELTERTRRLFQLHGKSLRNLEADLKNIEIEGVNYLGRGVDKVAFKMGEDVLKFVHPAPLRSFEDQTRPMKKARGIPGVEQLVVASAHETAMATTYLPGSLPASMTVRGLSWCINPNSVALLGEMLATLQERGLYVDSPSNVVVGPSGFAVFDVLDNPRGAINDMRSFVDDVAGWQKTPRDYDFTPRPFDEQATIRNAFMAALRASR